MSTRFAIALTLILALVSTASAKKKSVNVNGRELSGFNALDYTLQKPLGNPSFPEGEKGFGHHLFFGVNAGGTYISNNVLEKGHTGFNVGAHIGGWFTPVHGMRLIGNFGKYSKSSGDFDVTSGSIRADYLLNLTSLLRGYNPDRKFELVGATGLMYKNLNQHGAKGGNFGLAASLQMRYNLANSLYVYLEPEVSMLAGPEGSRLYTDLALSIGLGYQLQPGRRNAEGTVKFMQSPEDNIFYGVAGGLFSFNNPGAKMNSPIATAFLGKMFSSTSGLQLTGRYGHIHKGLVPGSKNIGIGSLDYVLNLNNAFSGYRPDDLFQMMISVGPSVAMAQNTHKFYPGIHGALTGLFQLSHNWGVFVSPQVYGFTNGFNRTIGVGKRPMISIDLGVRYTVGDFKRRFNNVHFTQSDSTQRWFFNAAVGSGWRFRFGRHPIYDCYVGVGKRFTPVSSWRFNIEGEYMSHYGRVTAGIDYLSSMTTAICGYKEDRVFDLQAVAGVFAGGAKLGSPVKVTAGVKAGFQANFRLTRHLGLYLESQILAVYGPYHEYMIWAPDARMQIGVKYNW